MHETEAHVLINVVCLVQLKDHHIPHNEITWSHVSMTSDRWICVRHSKENDTYKFRWLVLDRKKNYEQMYSGWTEADSIHMHPSDPIIALKAHTAFQVFNLSSKRLLCETNHSEKIVFWTWLNTDIIGFVTATAIYHWSVWKQNSSPKKIFYRHSRLKPTQIVSYKTDRTLRWLAITGLVAEVDRISGVTQVYCVNEGVTQCIQAHAVCFAMFHFINNPYPSTVLCAASRDTGRHGKIHVVELSPYMAGNLSPKNLCDTLDFTPETGVYDFPTIIQVSNRYGLMFMITKHSYLYICDMESAASLCYTRITEEIMFTAVPNSRTQGIIGIAKNGKVIAVELQKTKFIYELKHTAKTTFQANRLEKRINELEKIVSNECQYCETEETLSREFLCNHPKRTLSNEDQCDGTEETLSRESQGNQPKHVLSNEDQYDGTEETLSRESQGNQPKHVLSNEDQYDGTEETLSRECQGNQPKHVLSNEDQYGGTEETLSRECQGNQPKRVLSNEDQYGGTEETLSRECQGNQPKRVLSNEDQYGGTEETLSRECQGNQPKRVLSNEDQYGGTEETLSRECQGNQPKRVLSNEDQYGGTEETLSRECQGNQPKRVLSNEDQYNDSDKEISTESQSKIKVEEC